LKTLAFLSLALALTACATPPARHGAYASATQAYYDGFQEQARQVRGIRLPLLAEAPLAEAPNPRRGRARRVAVTPTPVQADCSVPSSLNSAAAERCRIIDRQALTELAFRHSGAMASYFSALAVIATRFDPAPGAAQVEESRAEAIALGDDLMRVAGIDGGTLEPYRPVAARVGLRPAFATEMVSHGWQMRRQWEIHDLALAKLMALPGGDIDRGLRRLRATTAHLRDAFEALIGSDQEALPMIAGAREALGG
jgi:hypothetical protein